MTERKPERGWDDLRARMLRYRAERDQARDQAAILLLDVARLIAERDRLWSGLAEVKRRLTDHEWSSHAEDRIRFALLHIEAVEAGRAVPAARETVEVGEAYALVRQAVVDAENDPEMYGFSDIMAALDLLGAALPDTVLGDSPPG